MKWFKHVLIQTGIWSGLVAGVMGIVLFLSLYWMKIGILDGVFRLDFMTPLPFLVFSLYFFRKKWDELRIWQGLILGAVTVAVSAGIYIFFTGVFLAYIDTDFLTYSKNIRFAEIEALNVKMMNSEQYKEEFVEVYPDLIKVVKDVTIGSLLVSKLIWHFGAGAIYSIFMSLLFRK